MIIALDGPAASGKGTLGKRIALHYGLRHLDTGLIYRAVAKALVDAGAELTNAERAAAAARTLDPARFDEQNLKTHEIAEAASIVSALPQVRAALVAFQREFGRAPPGAGQRLDRLIIELDGPVLLGLQLREPVLDLADRRRWRRPRGPGGGDQGRYGEQRGDHSPRAGSQGTNSRRTGTHGYDTLLRHARLTVSRRGWAFTGAPQRQPVTTPPRQCGAVRPRPTLTPISGG